MAPFSHNSVLTRAQLFESRLVLNPFLFLVFKSIISDNFLCYFLERSIINLWTKRITTEMFSKLSNLNSNLAITLGYLNPALNN